jgi:hypothetical protein
VTPRCEHALFLQQSPMDGKIEQHVCVKFCVKLDKSATETPEMLREAFGEHCLSRSAVLNFIHVSRPVECQLKMTNLQSDQAPAERQIILKKFENSTTKTVFEQSMSSQTRLGSVMEFARFCYCYCYCYIIMINHCVNVMLLLSYVNFDVKLLLFNMPNFNFLQLWMK